MNLSDLQDKDIINVIDGKNVGNIVDVIIDSEGKMDSFVVLRKRFFLSFFGGREEIHIKWNQIEKIGEDVILVKMVVNLTNT